VCKHLAARSSQLTNCVFLNPVILSEVRRQPNEVEGPRVSWQHYRPLGRFYHGSPYKSITRAPWWKILRVRLTASRWAGPSTPLGGRLAALKKTELEKVQSDDGHNVPCIFESAILRVRSHAQRD